jgi:hypothetical protein
VLAGAIEPCHAPREPTPFDHRLGTVATGTDSHTTGRAPASQ